MNALEMSADEFRKLSEQILDIAVDYLNELPARSILPRGSAVEIENILRAPFPEEGLPKEALASVRDIAACSRAQNGGFFGYVLGSGDPAAAAVDLLCSVLNQNVTAWRSSPAAVTIEREVIGWLGQAIGCQGFEGSLTGGGSSANLMGMAMAREAKFPVNESGARSVAAHTVYASSEAHMSIGKAVALLGIGRDNLRLIPVDDAFRMKPEELAKRMQRDQELGVTPLAVVATAGTVNTGALDPILEIAKIAASHGAWLHVDGSYGALAALAAPDKFPGLALASSISLDPHKWLYQPLDCGCLLYRDPQAARTAFAHSGEYVRALSEDPIEGYAFFEESIELSRRFRALKLWFSFRYHGFQSFRSSIRKDLEQAQYLCSLIGRTVDLELLAPVTLSAVCFRYIGSGNLSEVELNRLNKEILRRINARGRVYLSNATLHSKFCLRACIVNHRTTKADVDAVLSETLSAAKEVEGAD